jgi:hypothetical protein
LASGAFVVADHVGIGENGDAIVAWETYQEFCNDGVCLPGDFALHTSRNNGRGWVPTGVLLGPESDSHNAFVALDSSGHAMLLALNSSGAYVSATQSPSGSTWSAFNKAAFFNGISLISGFASDAQGNVTLVYEAIIGFSSSQGFFVNGSMADNTWSSPATLTGSDTNVSQIYFAVASNGVGSAVWLSSTVPPQIHATIRANSTAAWNAPATVSAPGPTEISPEAAAVSSSGSAIITYSGYNQAAVHTEYVSNYTP